MVEQKSIYVNSFGKRRLLDDKGERISNIVLIQFLLVFRDNCLSDLELLSVILDCFAQSRDKLILTDA
ncbi:hypothetical protein ACWN6Y_04310 [Vagococcus teuberi]|uniref:Uncharacterized protein n=1 Tax=Vagococcus teuberi TaxID=519472 RepID=A0A1J0A7K5_9ENTE|nr:MULTISPECIES: hypothetical protein [Vagococcus]APB31912.1 hypothetical protein BHY08_08850 [Vagococcus teuberi]RHH70048.1 hypothetical protein DW196_04575 [Vagococcus sp. AM17-17]